MDVIDIGADNLEPISINMNDSAPKVNFGSGLELLMNDKKRNTSGDNIKVDLGELDDLESELNTLSGNASSTGGGSNGDTKSFGGMASNLFGIGGFSKSDVQVEPEIAHINDENNANLGQATRESIGTTKTWDGYAKMNEVPRAASAPQMNSREARRKKRMMLKKMEDWYEKGQVKQNSSLNMDTSFEEVEDEYETIMDEKRQKDSIKLQGWWFMTAVNSMEYANAVFDPFGLNLDGWGEQINEDIESYEDIFAELHDKYKGGKMAPELSLLLRVGFSAAVLNFSNKALSSATPGFDDVIKQSPELMKMFTDATVNSMSQQSPAFNMANNMMGNNNSRGPPPPAPVNTQEHPPPHRPGMTYTETPGNRPDISASRGSFFKESGVELNNQTNANEAPTSMRPVPRPEMKGPQSNDIDDILSGLKTKNINIQPTATNNTGNDSMVSVSSLKELQNTNIPKKSNRKRNTSEKNVISLDI